MAKPKRAPLTIEDEGSWSDWKPLIKQLHAAVPSAVRKFVAGDKDPLLCTYDSNDLQQLLKEEKPEDLQDKLNGMPDCMVAYVSSLMAEYLERKDEDSTLSPLQWVRTQFDDICPDWFVAEFERLSGQFKTTFQSDADYDLGLADDWPVKVAYFLMLTMPEVESMFTCLANNEADAAWMAADIARGVEYEKALYKVATSINTFRGVGPHVKEYEPFELLDLILDQKQDIFVSHPTNTPYITKALEGLKIRSGVKDDAYDLITVALHQQEIIERMNLLLGEVAGMVMMLKEDQGAQPLGKRAKSKNGLLYVNIMLTLTLF